VLVNAARNASGGYLRGNLRAGHSYSKSMSAGNKKKAKA